MSLEDSLRFAAPPRLPPHAKKIKKGNDKEKEKGKRQDEEKADSRQEPAEDGVGVMGMGRGGEEVAALCNIIARFAENNVSRYGPIALQVSDITRRYANMPPIYQIT